MSPLAQPTTTAATAASSAHSRAKRAGILDAALRVFARCGYDRARVSDIAREAGIAYGLVYHYFPTKESLLQSLFEERWTGFLEAAEEIGRRSRRSEGKLLDLADLVLSGLRSRPEWVQVLVLEIQRTSRFSEPSQVRAVEKLFQLVSRIVRDGQAAGELRRDLEPDVAAAVFVGALDIVITSRVLRRVRQEAEPGAERPELARTVVDIVLRGLAGGSASGAAGREEGSA
jgi:AcrR family transcriptional regulator